MQSTIYIFGRLAGGYTQFPDDYASDICKNFVKSASTKSQIIIHRDKGLMYYGYVRQLDVESQYIGFCLLLNGIMLSKINVLFPVFERVVQNMTMRGEILRFNDQGKIVASVRNLMDNQEETERVLLYINSEIKSLEQYTKKLPPVKYASSINDKEFFTVNDNNEDIINASCKNGYTCVQKNWNYETSSLKSYKNVIIRLNKEKSILTKDLGELKARYEKLNKRKKQYEFVGILGILALFLIIGLFSVYRNLTSTKGELTEANRTITYKSEEIHQLYDSLNYANEILSYKNARIDDLSREVNQLTEKLKEEKKRRQQAEEDLEFFLDD